jgi:predicted histidine transporter YuiF (NhaC family)
MESNLGIAGMIISIITATVGGIITVIKVYNKEREKINKEHSEERKFMMDKYDAHTRNTQKVVEADTRAKYELASSHKELTNAITTLTKVVDDKLQSNGS